jgi:hypothetical protein
MAVDARGLALGVLAALAFVFALSWSAKIPGAAAARHRRRVHVECSSERADILLAATPSAQAVANRCFDESPDFRSFIADWLNEFFGAGSRQAQSLLRFGVHTRRLFLVFADLVADDASDRGSAHRAERAAAREERAADRSNPRAARGVFVASRHSAATHHAEHHCRGNRAHCPSLDRFHWTTFFSDILGQQKAGNTGWPLQPLLALASSYAVCWRTYTSIIPAQEHHDTLGRGENLCVGYRTEPLLGAVEAALDDNPRRDSVIFALQVWNPAGAEPGTLWQRPWQHQGDLLEVPGRACAARRDARLTATSGRSRSAG